jgi:patatin-related protein
MTSHHSLARETKMYWLSSLSSRRSFATTNVVANELLVLREWRAVLMGTRFPAMPTKFGYAALGLVENGREQIMLREKELRIALVCFGGVSLAVYMHGITKEILKLARASSALHAITDRTARPTATFFNVRDSSDPEFDTEPIYFDLLREIGSTIDLRVIVDIVAGASAGGINSVMLARALSHDLPIGRLRDLWLEKADVTELLAPEAKASIWSKWILRPIIWVAARLRQIRDPEVRSKLSLLLRSRWFEPPFDGLKLASLLYDAVVALGAPRGRHYFRQVTDSICS